MNPKFDLGDEVLVMKTELLSLEPACKACRGRDKELKVNGIQYACKECDGTGVGHVQTMGYEIFGPESVEEIVQYIRQDSGVRSYRYATTRTHSHVSESHLFHVSERERAESQAKRMTQEEEIKAYNEYWGNPGEQDKFYRPYQPMERPWPDSTLSGSAIAGPVDRFVGLSEILSKLPGGGDSSGKVLTMGDSLSPQWAGVESVTIRGGNDGGGKRS